MKKFILTGLICLFSFPWIRGQEYIPQITHRHYTSDSTLLQPRRPWKAALETFGLNMLVWSFDRYIVKEDWAYINGHTIKSNFKKGPVWDTDQFTTNLFSHPYHGSLYFNAARSNGMNFWQSAPFAAGGSLMWEFFMENEPPSINDMLATTFGGIELGEITYRLSDLFIDNRSSGAERVGREVLGRHFVAGPRLQPYHFRRSLATRFFKRTNLLFRSRQFYRHDGTSFPRRTRRFETGNDQSEH